MSDIWDLKTLNEVRQMYTMVKVDGFDLTNKDYAFQMQQSHYRFLCDTLDAQITAKYGCGPGEHTIAVSSHRDLETDQHIIKAQFAPDHSMVQLVGGPADGVLVHIADVHKPLVVTIGVNPPEETRDYIYRLSGWNTRNTCWLFSGPSEDA